MKTSEEIKNLLIEVYCKAYHQGYSDRCLDIKNQINIGKLLPQEEIEEYIFNNNIYLFEDYVKS